MQYPSLIHRLWRALRRWWQAWKDHPLLEETAQVDRKHPIADELSLLPAHELEHFLNTLGVTLEGRTPVVNQQQRITVLQRSRNYDALYRIDLVSGQPLLLVLLPTAHLLCFEGYLVRLHPSHLLFGALTFLLASPGSAIFHREREHLLSEMLFTVAESMKALFWAGLASGSYPAEIVVEQIVLRGEVPDDASGA